MKRIFCLAFTASLAASLGCSDSGIPNTTPQGTGGVKATGGETSGTGGVVSAAGTMSESGGSQTLGGAGQGGGAAGNTAMAGSISPAARAHQVAPLRLPEASPQGAAP